MSNQQSLSNKVFFSTIWSFVEAFSRQSITFIMGLVLARLLFPSDYGLIGMLQFFLAICQSFIDCGFSNALICKKDRNDKDFSTAFYFNLIIGIIAYAILFAIAPFVADFYNEPILCNLLRVVGLNVFFNSLCIVQNAILQASMRMKLLMRVTVISQLLTGVVGIVMAYMGWGVWALAFQSILGSVATTILLWFVTKWRPLFVFSKESFRYLWEFGSKMLFVGLISNAYSNIHTLIIGKVSDKNELGLFSKANSLSRLIPNTLYSILNKVSLPALSSISDDQHRLKSAFRMYMRVAAFIVFPIMGILFTLAEPLILFLWTDRWAAAIPVFQIITLGCIWNTLDLLSISILQVVHQPGLLLKYEIANKIVGFLILLCSLPFGFYAVIAGRALYNFYEYMVYTRTNKRFLGYTYKEQTLDIIPTFLIMIGSCAVAHVATLLFTQNFIKLIVGGFVGISIYIFSAYVFKLRSFDNALQIIKKLRH